MIKKITYLLFVMLLFTGGYLLTQEIVTLNAFGITVQDESLPNNLPDYPIEADVIIYENNAIFFDSIDIVSPYLFTTN